jgi:RNA polymerase sigma factor (sigma-70 family)
VSECGAELSSFPVRAAEGGAASEPESERHDVCLLRRTAAGDQDAMSEFYERHGRVVLGQILLMVGERALAEEILQDTMLAIWQGAGSFRGESRARSWLIAIARRQARDRLRRLRLRVVDDARLAERPSRAPGPEVIALDRAKAARRWGKYYAFRYLGSLDRGASFTVESYGAFRGRPVNPARQQGVIIGADLYAVYHPGNSPSRPAANSDLQFIQVVNYHIGRGLPESKDDTDRANPFTVRAAGSPQSTAIRASAFPTLSARGLTTRFCRRISS